MNRGFANVWLAVGLVVIIGGAVAWWAVSKPAAAPCVSEGKTWEDGKIVQLSSGKAGLCENGKWVDPQEIPEQDRLHASRTSGPAPLTVTFISAEGVPAGVTDSGVSINFGDGSSASVNCERNRSKLENACVEPVVIQHTYTHSGTFTAKLIAESWNVPTVRASIVVIVN